MGKDIKSLINMASKSKPYLPLLFATGGLTQLTQFNLVPLDSELGDMDREYIPEKVSQPLGAEVIIEPLNGAEHKSTMIWLHGLGYTSKVILFVLFII